MYDNCTREMRYGGRGKREREREERERERERERDCVCMYSCRIVCGGALSLKAPLH